MRRLLLLAVALAHLAVDLGDQGGCFRLEAEFLLLLEDAQGLIRALDQAHFLAHDLYVRDKGLPLRELAEYIAQLKNAANLADPAFPLSPGFRHLGQRGVIRGKYARRCFRGLAHLLRCGFLLFRKRFFVFAFSGGDRRLRGRACAEDFADLHALQIILLHRFPHHLQTLRLGGKRAEGQTDRSLSCIVPLFGIVDIVAAVIHRDQIAHEQFIQKLRRRRLRTFFIQHLLERAHALLDPGHLLRIGPAPLVQQKMGQVTRTDAPQAQNLLGGQGLCGLHIAEHLIDQTNLLLNLPGLVGTVRQTLLRP